MWYRYLMETIRWDMLKQQCPTRQVLSRIADKWTMLVITLLAEEEMLRFSELRRQIEGISQKMLTQTLRGLERDGLLTRTVYATVPVTVEYRLTDLGRSLGDTVGAIRSWAYANMDEIEAARERYDLTSHAPVTTLNAACPLTQNLADRGKAAGEAWSPPASARRRRASRAGVGVRRC